MDSRCRNDRLLPNDRITNGAMRAFGLACGCAGCGNCLVGYNSMARCGNGFRIAVRALGASKGFHAILGTGCGGRDLACVAMARCGDGSLSLNDRITYGAMATFRLTGSGTSSGNSLVGYDSMTSCGNGFGVGVRALGASVGLNAVLGTGRGGCDLTSVAMAGCVGVGVFVAVGTAATSMGGVALSGTSGSCYLGGVAVAQSVSCSGEAEIAVGCSCIKLKDTGGATGKESFCNARDIRSAGQEEPLEEEVAMNSSILVWKIP